MIVECFLCMSRTIACNHNNEFLMIIHLRITCHAKYQSVSKLLLPSSYSIIVFTSYSSLAGESGQRDYHTL